MATPLQDLPPHPGPWEFFLITLEGAWTVALYGVAIFAALAIVLVPLFFLGKAVIKKVGK